MKICWFSIIILLSFLHHVPTNGDTYHYQVIRKICPSRTYHDPLKDKCRKVPGGGEMIKINLDARCSGGFLGLLAHSKKSKYYFVCKRDGVLTCMCKTKEHFSRIRLKCENKCRKNEEFTHSVVDHIMDKYKCAIMNGVYEDGLCLLPLATTTVDPQITSRSFEDFDNDKIDRLQKILNYLVFLRKINDQFRSYEESIEITSLVPSQASPSPRNFITDFTTQSSEPRSFKPIESEILEFKRIWNLDSAIPLILGTTDMPGRSFDDNNSTTTVSRALVTTTVSSKAFETTTVSSKAFDTTTQMLESEQTTQIGDGLVTDENSTGNPRLINSRTVTKTTTTDDPEIELEEYYEYFYEDDPHNVLFVSNATKKTVSGRSFDDFEEIKIVHEDVTGKAEDETTQQPITDGILPQTTQAFENETTTRSQDPKKYLRAEEFPTTTAEFSTTTEEISTTTEEFESTSIMAPAPLIKKLPGDLNYNDFDPILMKIMDFNDESTSKVTQEPPTSTTLEDFGTTQASTNTDFSTISDIDELSTTTDQIKTIDLRYLQTTTRSSETTTNFATTIDDGTTVDDQSTTESIDSKSFDGSTTKINDETSTNEMMKFLGEMETTTEVITSTTQNEFSTMESTIPITETENVNYKFDDLIFMTEASTSNSEVLTFTTEQLTSTTTDLITTIENLDKKMYQSILPSKISDSSEDSTSFIDTTTDSTTFTPESTTLFNKTSTLKVKAFTEDDSEEDLKRIISTTLKVPRIMKTRANTEASTLNSLETTTISNVFNDDKIANVSEKIEDVEKIKVKVDVENLNKKPLPSLNDKSKDGKPKDIEYYYDYEEYQIDDDGIEVKPQTATKELDKIKDGVPKILRKHRRDNSNEYYAESISASLEDRMKAKEDYNYFF